MRIDVRHVGRGHWVVLETKPNPGQRARADIYLWSIKGLKWYRGLRSEGRPVGYGVEQWLAAKDMLLASEVWAKRKGYDILAVTAATDQLHKIYRNRLAPLGYVEVSDFELEKNLWRG